MAVNSKELTKEQRIKKEKSRLTRLYRDLPDSKKKLAAGLIERAAFMRIEAEDLEIYLRENGWAEAFQQSEKVEPYDRARPQGQTYNTLVSNYQKIIKQLSDLQPKTALTQNDGFDDFVSERDEM